MNWDAFLPLTGDLLSRPVYPGVTDQRRSQRSGSEILLIKGNVFLKFDLNVTQLGMSRKYTAQLESNVIFNTHFYSLFHLLKVECQNGWVLADMYVCVCFVWL